MTIKEKKEYLDQAFYIDRQINIDIEKMEAMRASLYQQSAKYDKTGSQTVNDNSREKALCKVIDYEKKLNKEIDELVDKKLEIEKIIKALSDEKLREVLTRRYLLFQKFERISIEMHLELRWIYRLHKKGLNDIAIVDH